MNWKTTTKRSVRTGLPLSRNQQRKEMLCNVAFFKPKTTARRGPYLAQTEEECE